MDVNTLINYKDSNGTNNVIYPVTKKSNVIDLEQDLSNMASSINSVSSTVTSLETAVDSKVDKVSGKGLSTEDFTTAEKTKLSSIEANANNYVHPTNSGNKHIPSGGTSGQILGWAADGTAQWVDNSGGESYSDATTTTHGLMSAADKSKLDGIEDNATAVTVDSSLSSLSENPVQNKVVNAALGDKVDKVTGKGLSTNDFTAEYKAVLDGLDTVLDRKVDVINGKGLSTEDYTTNEKSKLAAIEAGANRTIVDNALSGSSTNPVQNRVVKTTFDAVIVFATPEMYGAVGDGIADDSTAIRSAINSNYPVVKLSKSYYTGDENTFVIPANKTIVIDGEIIAGAHGVVFTNMDYVTSHAGYTGNGNITLCGNGRIYINGHVNTENTATPIRFAHAENIVIKDITVEDVSQYHAIEIIAVNNCLIENVTFKGMSGANGLLQPSIQLEGAVSQEHQYGAIPYDGTGCRDITITGCCFCKGENTERLPIGIAGGTAGDGQYQENVTITNNRFYDLSYCCIALDSFKNLVVSDNVAENIGMCFVGQTGVALNGVYNGLFSNNIINHVGYDVSISSSNRFCFMICNSHRISIIGNRCYDGYMGSIALEVCDDNYIANNVFEYMLRYNVAKGTDSYRQLFLRESQNTRLYANKFMVGNDDRVSMYVCTNWGTEKSGYLNEIRLNSPRYNSELNNLNGAFIGADSIRTSLSSGEDLNDYKTEGKYYCYTGEITVSLLNRPTNVNYAGTLKVEMISPIGTLLQTWISHDFRSDDTPSTGIWARTWTTSAWTAWRKIV